MRFCLDGPQYHRLNGGADPEMVQGTVPQSKSAETYNATCAAIDKHNRYCPDDLAMEKRLKQRSDQN